MWLTPLSNYWELVVVADGVIFFRFVAIDKLFMPMKAAQY